MSWRVPAGQLPHQSAAGCPARRWQDDTRDRARPQSRARRLPGLLHDRPDLVARITRSAIDGRSHTSDQDLRPVPDADRGSLTATATGCDRWRLPGSATPSTENVTPSARSSIPYRCRDPFTTVLIRRRRSHLLSSATATERTTTTTRASVTERTRRPRDRPGQPRLRGMRTVAP
jgi:hypothetical protein